MPISNCCECGGTYQWKWEEAFDKFGFNDGDSQVETYQVETELERAGYVVDAQSWGMHNTLIVSIRKDGVEQMPLDDPNVQIGYSEPRSYLPPDIVKLLDEKLSWGGVLE